MEYLYVFLRFMNWGIMWNWSVKEGFVVVCGDFFLLNFFNCILCWFIWNEILILCVSEIVYIFFVFVICFL